MIGQLGARPRSSQRGQDINYPNTVDLKQEPSISQSADQPHADPTVTQTAAPAVAVGASAAEASSESGLLTRLDRIQRSNPVTAIAYGVAKKFGEDRAGYLAALIAYFGFFSIFPLLLALISILGFVLESRPDLTDDLVDSAASQIPMVGDQIASSPETITGSTIAIVVGVLGALWAGLKVVDAMRNGLNEVWDIPRVNRPKLLKARLTGLVMLLLLLGGVVGTIALTAVVNVLPDIGGSGRIAIAAGSVAISIVMYWLAFQLLTDDKMRWRSLLPGAILGGTGWWALQTYGTVLMASRLVGAKGTYGNFASIIALLTFMFIAAQVSILAAVINVVLARRLWPRSLTGDDLTDADARAFRYLVESAITHRSQRVHVEIKETP